MALQNFLPASIIIPRQLTILSIFGVSKCRSGWSGLTHWYSFNSSQLYGLLFTSRKISGLQMTTNQFNAFKKSSSHKCCNVTWQHCYHCRKCALKICGICGRKRVTITHSQKWPNFFIENYNRSEIPWHSFLWKPQWAMIAVEWETNWLFIW